MPWPDLSKLFNLIEAQVFPTGSHKVVAMSLSNQLSPSSWSSQSAEDVQQKSNGPSFLRNHTIAIAGNLGGSMDDPARVGRVIQRYAGKYVADDDVLQPTHLICSPAEYANPGKKGTDNRPPGVSLSVPSYSSELTSCNSPDGNPPGPRQVRHRH